MEIVDMQEVTFRLLKSILTIKKVSTDYPSNWSSFPTAIYRTSRAPHFTDNKQNELQTFWVITVEIYGDDRSGDMTPIATSIDKEFKTIGFKGTFKDANTAGMTRIICEFSAVVDNNRKYVFQK